MIIVLTKCIGCCALMLWLAACGSSPPSHFYRLSPGDGSIGSQQQPSLGVGPVEVPDFLQRSALVYSGGDNHLVIAGSDLWAEPLAEGIQRVLGLNLAQNLDTENLTYFPWDPRHPPAFGIRVSVLDLDADETEATLSAEWLLFHPSSGEVITRRISQFTQPLATGSFSPARLPPAYSALLSQLADTIASEIRQEQQKPPEPGEASISR